MIIIIFFLIDLSSCDTNWVFYQSDLTQSGQPHTWTDVSTSTPLTSYTCLNGNLYYYEMLTGTAEIQNSYTLPTRLFYNIRIQMEIHFLQDQNQQIQIMANNIVLLNQKIEFTHDPTSITGGDCSGVPYIDQFNLFDLYFPYNTPQPANLIVNIKSTGTGIYTISNFFIWIQYCDPQCIECSTNGECLRCGNNFTPDQYVCQCFDYYLISGPTKQCVEDCPIGYYPDNYGVCQVGVETALYQDLNPSTFNTYNFIWTADLYYSQNINSNKLITIGTQTVAGPFYYNEKITYNINIAANILIKGSFTYYLFGASYISRSTIVLINGLKIGYLSDYFELMALLPQVEISKSSCTTVIFTQCNQYQVEFTYQATTIINTLEFQTRFPLSTTDCAWGIRDLKLTQLLITGTTTLTSCPSNCATCLINTCISCSLGFLYNGTCVSTCPTYLSVSGSQCVNNDLGTRGQYLLRGFTGGLEPFSIFDKLFYASSVDYQYYTSVYKGNWIFGGYSFSNSWTSGSFLAQFSNLPYHYQIIVQFKGVLVDGTGKVTCYVDATTFDSTNTGVSANYIGQLTNENEIVGSGTIAHTSNTMILQLQCISTGGICGIYDLVVIIKRCPSYCSVCTSETTCTTYLSTPNNTLSACNLKFYYDASTDLCLSCEVGCDVCASQHSCTQCSTGYLLSYGNCYNPNGYEVAASTQCGNGCSLCYSVQDCLVCNTANKFWMNSGLCSCIPGYYQDDDLTCQLCHPICKTCTRQPRQCMSCFPAQFRTYNYDNCLCSDGYFQEYDNNVCSVCDTICRTCISISSFCTSCQATQFRVLSGSQCVCQEGYYDSNAYICSVCSDQCFGCRDFSYCLSCHSSQFKQLSILGGTCVCNSGYYKPSTGLNCLQCDVTCLQCSNGTSTDCTRCPTTRIQTLQSTVFGCKCLAGYYDNGSKECISCLTMINPPIDNYCYSVCGDGIIQWNEECDDANNNTRDSCINCHLSNSECLKETCTGCFANKCISCIDGYYITESNKCEQCDESCIKCKDKPDNCTQCLFSVAASTTSTASSTTTCLRCPKSQGYKYDNGKCSNICGDGLTVLNETCDDGNLKQGDGCDQTCQVEKGWICKQTCTRIIYPQLIIEEDNFDQYFSSSRKVTIKVTQPLMITGSLISNFNYTILEMPSANFSFLDLTTYDTQYVSIKFELTITLTQASDNVTLKIGIQAQNFIDQQNQTFNVTDYNFSLTYYNPPSQAVISATAGVMSLNQYILYVLLGLAGVAFLFGGLDIFWNLLDNLQLLSYLQYFNVIYPYNLVNYFTIFGFAQFTFISQYTNIEGYISQDIDTPDADYAFAQEGYSSVFIVNIITVLTVFLTTLLIYLGCQLLFIAIEKLVVQEISEYEIDYDDQNILLYFLFRLTKNLQQTLAQINREFKSGLLRTYMAVAFDYNLAIFLQFKGFYNEGLLLFSGILSIFAFLMETYFIYQGFLLLSRQQYFLKLKSTRNEIGSLYEGLEIYNFKQFYNMLSLCKKMLFMMFLVLLYDCPSIQILMVTSLNMIQLVYIIRYKPFEDELEYYKNVGSEFLLWLIELLIISFTYDLSDDSLINIGWAVMSLATFFIFYQLYFDVKQHAEFLASEYIIIRKMMNKIASLLNRQQFERQNFIKSPSSKSGSSKKTLSKLKVRKFVTFTIAGQK